MRTTPDQDLAAIAAVRAAWVQAVADGNSNALRDFLADDYSDAREGGEPRDIVQRALLILRRGADGTWRYARGMTNGLPGT